MAICTCLFRLFLPFSPTLGPSNLFFSFFSGLARVPFPLFSDFCPRLWFLDLSLLPFHFIFRPLFPSLFILSLSFPNNFYFAHLNPLAQSIISLCLDSPTLEYPQLIIFQPLKTISPFTLPPPPLPPFFRASSAAESNRISGGRRGGKGN